MSGPNFRQSREPVNVLYICQGCGGGFKVQYEWAGSVQDLVERVRSYPDGCPNCGSYDTKLAVASR
jgi:hypothetical protein